MNIFNLVLTKSFDVLLCPFAGAEPMWGLTFVSVLTGAIMVWLFGKFSNQEDIRKLKDKIKGHMLEMWIFRDNAIVVLRAQGRVFWNLAKYAACSLRALVVLMIPVVLIMIQLQARYGYEPLRPGQSAIVRIAYAQATAADAMNVALDTPDSIRVETPALRIPEDREVDFRIKADRAGTFDLVARAGGEQEPMAQESLARVTKTVCVGKTGRALSPVRSASWLTRLLYPVESAMPQGPLDSIEVGYPSKRFVLWGMRFHWVWPFFVISIVAGLLLKKPLGVEL